MDETTYETPEWDLTFRWPDPIPSDWKFTDLGRQADGQRWWSVQMSDGQFGLFPQFEAFQYMRPNFGTVEIMEDEDNG